MKRLFRISLCVLLILCTILPGALAASKTYKGLGSTSYTITTGKKDAKLTISGKSGQYAQKFVSYNGKKNTEVKANGYAVFDITVDGVTKTVSNRSATFNLKARRTYTVIVSYKGFYGFNKLLVKAGYNPKGSQYWKKNPSVSVSVNNSAKIK